jgi:hypothetical protein
MNRSLLLRNRAVARIVVGIPEDHEHLRARIESASGDVITLQEATLAALVRAYVDIKTHPNLLAVELRSELIEARKPGFAEHQLLEVGASQEALRAELANRPSTSVSSDETEQDDDEGFVTQPLPELDISSGQLRSMGEESPEAPSAARSSGAILPEPDRSSDS